MMIRLRRVAALLGASVSLLVVLSVPAAAQDATTVALAKELAGLLDQGKLDSVAAPLADTPDAFVAALYFSGSELLVVSAKYAAPPLLAAKIKQKGYRDVYMDLNGVAGGDSKIFVEDLGADGLTAHAEPGHASDTYETSKVHVAFDGDWKKQKMSEDDYTKAFSAAESEYAKMLGALLATLKKAS